MIIEKEFKENIRLHILYFTLETCYPSYPSDVKRETLRPLNILKKHIDHDYGNNYDLIEQEFFSKNKYEKI